MDPYDKKLCQFIKEELDNILESRQVEVDGLLNELVCATQNAFNRFLMHNQNKHWGSHSPDGGCCDV